MADNISDSLTSADASLAAALLVIQVVLAASIMLGMVVSGYWKHRSITFPWRIGEGERSSGGMFDVSVLMIWFVITVSLLTLTALNLPGWKVMGFDPVELNARSASLVALSSDLFLATWFVFRSGGWSDSPFTSILVAVPTFAILLKESTERIFFYIIFVVCLSAVFFYLNSEYHVSGTNNSRDRRRLNGANWILSSAMLTLTAWIGVFGAR